MSRLTVLKLVALSSAAYFLAMYWLSAHYDPAISPYAMPGIANSEIIQKPFEPLPDSTFAVRGYDFYFADDADKEHSNVTLYEDDHPLGPSHSGYEAITKMGMGRFAHTKGSYSVFIFSSSDNTNPNTNGRTYWAVRRPVN